MMVAMIGVGIILVIGTILIMRRNRSHRQRRQAQRRSRRIRNSARARAWEVVFGRRKPRLTYRARKQAESPET